MDAKNVFKDKLAPLEGLTFDDLLLIPNYTDFKRQDVNLTAKLHPNLVLRLPVISAPMDTVTEAKMAAKLAVSGALGIIHRNLNVATQAQMVHKVKQAQVKDKKQACLDKKGRLLVGAAVGVGPDFQVRVKSLLKAQVDVIVVDSGHGHSKPVIEATQYLKKHHSTLPVVSGNVATYEGTKALIEAGADVVKVGMGPGSICTTRIIAGMGMPQLTAVAEALRAAKPKKVPVIADGGVRQLGDIAKALALGASAVMLGSLFSGFDESPGETVRVGGKQYKQYRGMGSVAAMKKGAAERYGQSRETDKKKLISEGVESLVPYKGQVEDFLVQIEGSLRTSFYYLGSRTLSEFQKKARFIRISNSGLSENHPHSLKILNAGGNYFL